MKRIEKKVLKERVLNGQEPSGIMDSGATSTFASEKDEKHFIPTGKMSDKVVKLPNGKLEKAGKKLILDQDLREPANKADGIPALKQTLVSTSKMANAGYITVFDEEEVNVYEAKTTEIKPSQQAVLTGWRDRITGLWRVPLKATISNPNTDTKLLSK